jgi:hypothetical protein
MRIEDDVPLERIPTLDEIESEPVGEAGETATIDEGNPVPTEEDGPEPTNPF